jgi:hypothetical protein
LWATNHVYHGLLARPGSGILVYWDDFCIYADSIRAFAKVLREVNDRHERHNVVVSRSKIKNPSNTVVWGGWLVSSVGMALTAKFLAKPDPPAPTTLADWQQQIGALNYFSHNVPGLSLLLAPAQAFLTASIATAGLISRKGAKLKRFVVDAPANTRDALRAAWDAVRNRPLLAHHDSTKTVVLVTDASSTVGWSAVYLIVATEQWRSFRGGEIPIHELQFDVLACRSGTWTQAQRAWPVHRQEFFAVVTAITDAPYYFLGAAFAVLCDNIDTVHWLSSDFVQNSDYAARAGPDGLARIENGKIDIPDVNDLRQRFLILAHMGHRGAHALAVAIQRRGFSWSSLIADAVAFVAHCVHCRVNRGPPLSHVPLGTVPIGDSFNSVVTLDHMSMGHSTAGFTDILVILCTFSRLVVLVPVNGTSASVAVIAFIANWVAIFGPPPHLLTDSGPAFTAELAQAYAEAAGANWHTTIPNVPRSHGTVERAIRDARHLFRTMLVEARLRSSDWALIAPAVAFAFNNTPAAALGDYAPIEVALAIPRRDPISTILAAGRPLRITPPADFADHVAEMHGSLSEIRAAATAARTARRSREHARADHALPVYQPGDWVLLPDLTRPTNASWSILAQVVSKESDYIYVVRPSTPPRDELRRHIVHLRAFDDASYNAPANLLEYAARYRDVEYPFSDFLDFRRDTAGRSFEVLVRWEGFPESEDSWVPIAGLMRDARTYTRNWFQAARSDPRFQDPAHTSLLNAVFQAYPQLSRGAV